MNVAVWKFIVRPIAWAACWWRGNTLFKMRKSLAIA